MAGLPACCSAWLAARQALLHRVPRRAEAIEKALSVPGDTQPSLKLRGGPGVGAVRGLGGIVQDPAESTPPPSTSTSVSRPTSSSPSTLPATQGPEQIKMSDYSALIRNRPQTMALIHFDTNSARIRSDAYTLLNEYANALKSAALANAVLLVAGHTDAIGSARYNLSYPSVAPKRSRNTWSHEGSRLID
ncbi:MAG: OmpA family protein [Candidatus Competibacteraceae bacterium]|nr:OmpA family protein [Candidatus Competibacteraceae bacterium]